MSSVESAYEKILKTLDSVDDFKYPMEEDEPNKEDIPLSYVPRGKLNAIQEDTSENENGSDSKTESELESNRTNKSKSTSKMEEEEDNDKSRNKSTNNLLDLDITTDDYDKLSDTEKTYALQYPEFIKSYQAVSDDLFESLSFRYEVLIEGCRKAINSLTERNVLSKSSPFELTEEMKKERIELLENERNTWKLLQIMEEAEKEYNEYEYKEIDTTDLACDYDICMNSLHRRGNIRTNAYIKWLEAIYEKPPTYLFNISVNNHTIPFYYAQTLVNDKGMEYDPDDVNRNHVKLYDNDSKNEINLLKSIFYNIRGGSIDEAIKSCKQTGSYFRIPMLASTIPLHYDENRNVVGNRNYIFTKLMNRKVALHSSQENKDEEIAELERVIYGSVSNSVDILLQSPYITTWEDIEWVDKKVKLEYELMKDLKLKMNQSFETMTNFNEYFNNIKSYQDDINNYLSQYQNKYEDYNKESTFHEIQRYIYNEQYTELYNKLYDLAVNDDETVNEKYLGFVTHFYIMIRMKNMENDLNENNNNNSDSESENQKERLCLFSEKLDENKFNNIIKNYFFYLFSLQLHDFTAYYISCLTFEERDDVLKEYLYTYTQNNDISQDMKKQIYTSFLKYFGNAAEYILRDLLDREIDTRLKEILTKKMNYNINTDKAIDPSNLLGWFNDNEESRPDYFVGLVSYIRLFLLDLDLTKARYFYNMITEELVNEVKEEEFTSEDIQYDFDDYDDIKIFFELTDIYEEWNKQIKTAKDSLKGNNNEISTDRMNELKEYISSYKVKCDEIYETNEWLVLRNDDMNDKKIEEREVIHKYIRSFLLPIIIKNQYVMFYNTGKLLAKCGNTEEGLEILNNNLGFPIILSSEKYNLINDLDCNTLQFISDILAKTSMKILKYT